MPDRLRNRIRERMSDRLGPSWPFISLVQEEWRKDAAKQLWLMRRIIREHTDYWDDVCTTPDCEKMKEYISHDAAEWRTENGVDIDSDSDDDFGFQEYRTNKESKQREVVTTERQVQQHKSRKQYKSGKQRTGHAGHV